MYIARRARWRGACARARNAAERADEAVVRLCWCGCSWVARYTACSDQIFTSQRHQRQPQTRHKRHAGIGTKLYFYFLIFYVFCVRTVRRGCLSNRDAFTRIVVYYAEAVTSSHW